MSIYCGIAADINNNLETFYYIKIGLTRNCAITRCDNQRLKHIWNIESIKAKGNKTGGSLITSTAIPHIYNDEKTILNFTSQRINYTKFDYKPAGYSESFGNYKTAMEAMLAAFELLEALNKKYNINYGFHPLAIPYLEAA